jgi:hypothetical protein
MYLIKDELDYFKVKFAKIIQSFSVKKGQIWIRIRIRIRFKYSGSESELAKRLRIRRDPDLPQLA